MPAVGNLNPVNSFGFYSTVTEVAIVTMPISGGPFLGLLGTVIGVLLTFAVIAATGDVNVNTIAPGVAAALTTTVAGLCVAIPSLFGYNYLAIRVRDIISADMSTFIEHFVSRLVRHTSRQQRLALLNSDTRAVA